MPEKTGESARQSQRVRRPPPAAVPEWYGWLALAAMLLLLVQRVEFGGGVWIAPLLSVGEWLMLPLGLASLSMGLLALPKLRERTLLPLWIAAFLPAALWLAAQGAAMARVGTTAMDGDLILSWATRLIFPSLVFLPLLANRDWRDKTMWALTCGLLLNVFLVIWRIRGAGLQPPDAELLLIGGSLANHLDYGLAVAVGLPLIAAWRGGGPKTRPTLAMMFCMFLLPSLALATCHAWAGVFGALAGLAVAWIAWRPHGWFLGIFVCLLAFGYGSAGQRAADRARRGFLASSATLDSAYVEAARRTLVAEPFLGDGPDTFMNDELEPRPWYAFLIGGSGLAGLGLWVVLLAELAGRSMGRDGRRDLMRGGGVLGATAGLAVACLWTDALPPGAGSLVGFLLAVSIIEDPGNAETTTKRRAHKAKPA